MLVALRQFSATLTSNRFSFSRAEWSLASVCAPAMKTIGCKRFFLCSPGLLSRKEVYLFTGHQSGAIVNCSIFLSICKLTYSCCVFLYLIFRCFVKPRCFDLCFIVSQVGIDVKGTTNNSNFKEASLFRIRLRVLLRWKSETLNYYMDVGNLLEITPIHMKPHPGPWWRIFHMTSFPSTYDSVCVQCCQADVNNVFLSL